jgi:beta-galactosidase
MRTWAEIVSCFLITCSPLISTAGAAGKQGSAIPSYYLVSREDCGNFRQEGHLVEGTDGNYTPTFLSGAQSAELSYSQGALVAYQYTGLQADALYKARAVYLSDLPNRSVTVLAGNVQVDGPFLEPEKKVLVREFPIPTSAIQNGILNLQFKQSYAGPAVRVSSIELWSTDRRVAENLVLTANGNGEGQITGILTNWLYKPVAGGRVRIQIGNRIRSARSLPDGSYWVHVPSALRPSLPPMIAVNASADNHSSTTELGSYEIYPPDIHLTPPPSSVGGLSGALQVSLDGNWNFTISPPPNFWMRGAVSPARSYPIRVPGEWSMQGFSVPLNGAAGYWRTVYIPANWDGMRIKLRCDAAFSLADVWVNGTHIGEYEGGFTPFEFDITDAVKPGESAVIALRIIQDTAAADLSAMPNYAQHELGGITRKIYLFAVPRVNVFRLHTETTFDAHYQNATLRLTVGITNQDHNALHRGDVRFHLIDPAGHQLQINPSTITLRYLPSRRDEVQVLDIPISRPEHWENEHPKLYTLIAELEVNGRQSETIERFIGFRQVEIRGNQLLLNGHAVKLHGVERHETNPLLGRSLNGSIWQKEIRLLRQANMNYVFTSHYPVPEEFLNLCDRYGLLVTEEVPFVWVGGPNGVADGNRNPKYYNTMATISATTLEHDRDHPSVIFWQTCDECRWARNASSLLSLFRVEDATRPADFSYDAGYSDFMSLHYPSLAEARLIPHQGGKPAIFDQYVHVNNYNRQENLTDPGLRVYYGRAIQPMWEAMYENPGILGGAIWEWSDDIFYVPFSGFDRDRFHGDPNTTMGRWKVGYGPWGIVDNWLREKPEFWNVKKTYSPVRIDENLPLPDPIRGQLKIPVENRYDFTNLSELRIQWATEGAAGIATADVPPRSRGVILVTLPRGITDWNELTLKFSHNGDLVDAYRLVDASREQRATSSSLPGAAPLLEQTEKSIRVEGRGSYWEFDRRTGMIIAGQSGRSSSAVIGGPFLAVTPDQAPSCCSQIAGPVEPLQPAIMSWTPTAVTAHLDGKSVSLSIAGSYPDYRGTYDVNVDPLGNVTIDYSFFYSGRDLPVREIGLMFRVPLDMDTIRWSRKGQWSWYPQGDLGRLEGTAPALRPDTSGPRVLAAEPPPWPWSEDATAAGTNDFRASKYNIIWASLTDSAMEGVKVVSPEGNQSVRAWLEPDCIWLLVADFSNGGKEPFLWRNNYAAEQRVLHNGDTLSGTITLDLLAGQHDK